MRFIKRTVAVLVAVMMFFSTVSVSFFAKADTEEHHYLAFASDVHGEKDKMCNALKGLPNKVDYISMIGDMVGDKGGDAPEYNSSEYFGPVSEMFEDFMFRNFSIIWADHDSGVNDDANVVVSKGGNASGKIFSVEDEDTTPIYYIYAVGFNAMTKGGETSRDSAAIFKRWVRKIDPSVPIIVLCHVPLWAKRGDNLGAPYWNEALNFAATGVEDITGEDNTHETTRNVIYLCGHNHTVDSKEYLYRPGTTMSVQIDTNESGGDDSHGPFGSASGTISSIYYTAMNAGYIKTSGNATLMDITEDEIILTKHNGGETVSLGTDGATGETLGTQYAIQRFKASDDGGPVIASQPQNAFVNYPDGASFNVEVEDPDDVASYQWYMLDKEDTLFKLDGYSAHTNTLIVPSTQEANHILRYYCVITDKDGRKTVSRRAALEISNYGVYKPVFYVGEFAVEPGETLDLSKIDIGGGYKLGKGTVSFDSNAKDITISNLDYDNSHTLCDLVMAPNVGLSMVYYKTDKDEYNVTFNGENRIMNTYFDYDYNLGGIPFDFYLYGEVEETPLVNLIGDGTLEITNGYNALRIIGDLMIDIDITVKQNRPEYADGIAANNIFVSKDRKLDLAVNGYGINANGNLFMTGADVKIDANVPHISKGTSTKKLILSKGVVNIENTNLDINMTVNRSICGETVDNSFIYTPGDLYISKGSNVKCNTEHIGNGIFNYYLTGISAKNAYLEDSALSMNCESEKCANALGISTNGSFEAKDSSLTLDLSVCGTVYGISAEKDFSEENCDIAVNTKSYDGAGVYGLVCNEAEFNVTDKTHTAVFNAENGLAIACDLKKPLTDEPVTYQEGYKYTNISFQNDAQIITPKDYEINLAAVETGDEISTQYAAVETVYEKGNTTTPAASVTIGVKNADYRFVNDDGDNKWKKGSDEGLTFSVKRSENDGETFSRFIGIKVDAVPVESNNYTVMQGSVIITLKPEYLNTLTVGKHVMTVMFNDGETDTEFTIQPAKEADSSDTDTSNITPKQNTIKTNNSMTSPNTGAESTFAFGMILISSGFVVSMLAISRRKRKDRS